MRIFIYLFYLIVNIVTFFPIQSQSKSEKYTQSLPLGERRISDGKLEFKEKGVFPAEWKLYFKGKQGDFVVFYDWNGHEIHYKYRRNKFDLDGEDFVRNLFPGNPYSIKGEWIGYYYYSVDPRGRKKTFSEKRNLPAKPDEFSDLQTIPIMKLISYDEIYTDELLY